MNLMNFMALMLQYRYELTYEDLFDLKYTYDEGAKTTHQRMLDAGVLN